MRIIPYEDYIRLEDALIKITELDPGLWITMQSIAKTALTKDIGIQLQT